MTTNQTDFLDTEPVGRIFMKYLIPSLIGMMIMALNIVIDGVMVGNRLGEVALAGVGIASPVYTIFVAMSLWIGMGGATLFSQAIGARDVKRAQFTFTHSIVLIALFTIVIGLTAFIFQEQLTYVLGANEETFPFANDYLKVMLFFGFILTIENALSTFIRNDQNPNLAMIALVVTAILNIVINYYILYVLHLGVAAVALGTIIAAAIGVLVLCTHFLRKGNQLRFVRIRFNKSIFKSTMSIGFPSFLSELGISVFTIAYNISLARIAGTAGVAAFSVLNYVHSVMLMIFLGMGSAVQPLISYYYGARKQVRIRKTMRIALIVASISGISAFVIGQLGARQIVGIFGDFDEEVVNIAITGIRLFFIAYLFMGINFIMMSYFQSIAQIKMATWITASREIIFMMIFILILPLLFGIQGVWLSIPLAEFIVLVTIFLYVRRNRDFMTNFTRSN
ncbi:MATE family efflux transporter [Oceanobacillus bengalensis]|uniref:Multidrug export protein MepA n=1 Tax=Oceanobacillus bengalensis TaxID=1435466 RepID=A0A494YU96_9BACI|nr:MATE family efflux transporter [Oceanobacillus bengalensis]RKQ13665.1 MATE family efflux transporter [Oceanobacillus bengalensis]